MHQSEIGVMPKERVVHMQTWVCDRREEKIEQDEQNDDALFSTWGNHVRLCGTLFDLIARLDVSSVRIDVG